MKKIKWGIIGLGNIAHQFTNDLLLIEDAELYGVASRTLEKASEFAQKYGAKQYFGSYDVMFEDKEIDMVYIATPHNSHAALSIKAMESGKHVLCEKPVAVNFNEASEMVSMSKNTGKFFMEAFWTRFNPTVEQVLMQLKKGTIGEVKYINADFAFRADFDKSARMTAMDLAGGSLLDVGVYPLFLSYQVLGVPEKIFATANFFESGADMQTSIVLQYKHAQAVLHSSFVSPSNMVATISGETGRINLNSVWHEAQSYSLIRNNHKVDYHHPTLGKGFSHEIMECHECIRSHRLESEKWSHQNMLDLVALTDNIRNEIGLNYPSEK